SVEAHRVLLVAGAAVARRLEDQVLAVATEISFRVLSAMGELADVGEVPGLVDGGTIRRRPREPRGIRRRSGPVGFRTGAGGGPDERSGESECTTERECHSGWDWEWAAGCGFRARGWAQAAGIGPPKPETNSRQPSPKPTPFKYRH